MNALKSIAQLNELAAALGGLPIIGVMEESPAGQQGLRYGDILMQIGPHEIRDVGCFVRARQEYPNELPLLIYRDGSEIELVLNLRNDRIAV